MRAVIQILLLISFIVLISCKPQQDVLRTNTNSTKVETITISEPSENSLTIDYPCIGDSIKNFSYLFSNNYTNTKFYSSAGKIIVQTNTDSIIQREIIKGDTITKEIKIEVPTPYIPNWVWYSIVFNFVFVGFKVKKFLPI